jgi:TPR repeat protein
VGFLSPLAAAGDPRALRLVGIAQATGRGAPKDEAAAVATFREARRAGDELGALLLARMLHEGRGAPRDDAAALALIAWARPGLETKPGGLGHLRLLARLGAEIAADRGDAETQVRWLRLGVTHGDPVAMRALGQRLVDGDGAPKDPEAGRALLLRADAIHDPKDPDPIRAPGTPAERR